MKLINKITFIIIFLFVNINAFGEVSSFVDSKSVTQKIAHGITFKPDGTKMFVVGKTQNKIFEFDLSTAFDISTATISSNEYDHGSEDDDATDIKFNSDGTKLFLAGAGDQEIMSIIYQLPMMFQPAYIRIHILMGTVWNL